MEHLTMQQMAEKYPNQYVGLTNVEYAPNGMTILSADVKYTDKSRDELDLMQIANGDIICWYTTPGKNISLGAHIIV